MALGRRKPGVPSRVRLGHRGRLTHHPPSTSGFFPRRSSIKPNNAHEDELKTLLGSTANALVNVTNDVVAAAEPTLAPVEEMTVAHSEDPTLVPSEEQTVVPESKDSRTYVDHLVHNLRQHVGVALANLELAIMESPKKNPTLDDALAAVRRIDSMTTAILTVSRAESDRLVIRRKCTNILKLLSTVVSYSTPASAVRIRTLQIPMSDPEIDEFHMSQVLQNLISNAVKYGKEATIDLEANDTCFRIHVRDQGPGFSSEDVPESSDTRAHGSFKIGLKYCQIIIDGHGGTLTKKDIIDPETDTVVGGHVIVELPLKSPKKPT